MFIYKITNKINGKIYVGKTEKSLEARFYAHLAKARRKVNRYLYDAMNHYGYDNFEISLIEECSTGVSLDEREKYWISNLNSLYPLGYNMTVGGGGGNTLVLWTEDQRRELYSRQAKARVGMKRTEEQKSRMSAAAKKREEAKTEQEKEEISNKIRAKNLELGICPPKEFWRKAGQEGFFKGKKHTEETKQKLSLVRKGKKYEDFLPIETAEQLKEKHRKRFSGSNNPLYIDFPKENKLLLLEHLLQKPDTSFKELVVLSGISLSEYKVRKFLRESGIKNLQQFRRLGNDKQRQILLEAINNVNPNYRGS